MQNEEEEAEEVCNKHNCTFKRIKWKCPVTEKCMHDLESRGSWRRENRGCIMWEGERDKLGVRLGRSGSKREERTGEGREEESVWRRRSISRESVSRREVSWKERERGWNRSGGGRVDQSNEREEEVVEEWRHNRNAEVAGWGMSGGRGGGGCEWCGGGALSLLSFIQTKKEIKKRTRSVEHRGVSVEDCLQRDIQLGREIYIEIYREIYRDIEI